MLLGRTANGLYWLGRYIERAENMARLVDAGLRLALMRTEDASDEWASVISSSGGRDAFQAKYSEYTAANVVDFLLRDLSNPSSVLCSIEQARLNARMVRTALTRETWEAINETLMSQKRALAGSMASSVRPHRYVGRSTARCCATKSSTSPRSASSSSAQTTPRASST
jgi:uncharacterized alpha-E superfamily protein